jgi:hypothetical protein
LNVAANLSNDGIVALAATGSTIVSGAHAIVVARRQWRRLSRGTDRHLAERRLQLHGCRHPRAGVETAAVFDDVREEP